MNTLGLGLIMAGGIAYVAGKIAQEVTYTYESIHMDIEAEKREHDKKKRAIRHLNREMLLNSGDRIIYKNNYGTIIGDGLNNTITILLDNGSILDVSAGTIGKVVEL